MGLWGVELWEKSPWSRIQQRNELSLMPSTGMVAPGPGTCCSAGEHKIRACPHVKLDIASEIQAWEGCQAKVMLCRSQGCSGTSSSRSFQGILLQVCWSCEHTGVQEKLAGRQSPRKAARLDLQEIMALLGVERRGTAAL